MLTVERLRELLSYDPETGIFTRRLNSGKYMRWKAGSVAGGVRNGYVIIEIDGKPYYAHRLAWLYMKGKWPEPEIDHRDMDPSNNAWRNLRLATRMEQVCHRNGWGRTGFKGVTYHKSTGKFRAAIRSNKRYMSLGLYHSPEAAHAAYCEAASRLHGEFAVF